MKYEVSVDLSGVALAAANALTGAMPAVQATIMAIGNEAMARWKSAVMHAPIWQGDKEPYANSIQMESTGPFSVRIYTDYKNAEAIESGSPAVDQKKYILTSPKARIVKDGPHKGQKYLIIPFRHNTPGNTAHATAMPQNVYQAALSLKKSRVTGSKLEANVHGRIDGQGNVQLVKRAIYKWGGSLPAGLAAKAHPSNKTDRYAGMVRMDTSVAGKKKTSAYLTFRVMGQWQTGQWIIPAKPGLFIAQGVAKEIQPLAETAIKQAFVEHAKSVLG